MDKLLEKWKERVDECCEISNINKELKEILIP